MIDVEDKFEAVGRLIASPDNLRPLDREGEFLVERSTAARYPVHSKIPYLFPSALLAYLHEGGLNVPLGYHSDPLVQYAMMAQIKGRGGSQNSDPESVWYKRHLEWATKLLAPVRGITLDIGCDNPVIARSMFPDDIEYIGLDPVAPLPNSNHFKIVGMAEFLPIKSNIMDNVCFMTSLDHVMDYLCAVQEASRVLRDGGGFFLATLVWREHAELCRDSVHFHHFREWQIFRMLEGFTLKSVERRPWKDDYRSVLYIHATKR